METRTVNLALQAAQASLEAQVAERTAALQSALAEVESRAAEQARLLDENKQQRATILEISVPVLPVSADTLVMPWSARWIVAACASCISRRCRH